MATRKKKKSKFGWGGRRPGAGRPKGTGTGPSPNSRRNRIAVMLRDPEFAQLTKLAKKTGEPPATTAYRILVRTLRRKS